MRYRIIILITIMPIILVSVIQFNYYIIAWIITGENPLDKDLLIIQIAERFSEFNKRMNE